MTNTKLIFLDFDGVLNSQLFYISGRADESPLGVRTNIDPLAVGYLNRIVKMAGADVVVTSTWRLDKTVEELQAILDTHGFVGKVIGKTEDLRVGPGRNAVIRGNEVLHWMQENGFSSSDFKQYVIIDDDSDFLYHQRNNMLIVDGYAGMTPNTAYKAIRILGS